MLYVPKFWDMLQYALKYESVRTGMPKFLCLFYLVFLSPPNTSLLRQQLQSLSRHAPTSGLYGRALRRPFQAPLQHRPHPLCRRAPPGGSSGLMDLPPPRPALPRFVERDLPAPMPPCGFSVRRAPRVWWISHLQHFWVIWFGMGLIGLPLRRITPTRAGFDAFGFFF